MVAAETVVAAAMEVAATVAVAVAAAAAAPSSRSPLLPQPSKPVFPLVPTAETAQHLLARAVPPLAAPPATPQLSRQHQAFLLLVLC